MNLKEAIESCESHSYRTLGERPKTDEGRRLILDAARKQLAEEEDPLNSPDWRVVHGAWMKAFGKDYAQRLSAALERELKEEAKKLKRTSLEELEDITRAARKLIEDDQLQRRVDPTSPALLGFEGRRHFQRFDEDFGRIADLLKAIRETVIPWLRSGHEPSKHPPGYLCGCCNMLRALGEEP